MWFRSLYNKVQTLKEEQIESLSGAALLSIFRLTLEKTIK